MNDKNYLLERNDEGIDLSVLPDYWAIEQQERKQAVLDFLNERIRELIGNLKPYKYNGTMEETRFLIREYWQQKQILIK